MLLFEVLCPRGSNSLLTTKSLSFHNKDYKNGAVGFGDLQPPFQPQPVICPKRDLDLAGKQTHMLDLIAVISLEESAFLVGSGMHSDALLEPKN